MKLNFYSLSDALNNKEPRLLATYKEESSNLILAYTVLQDWRKAVEEVYALSSTNTEL